MLAELQNRHLPQKNFSLFKKFSYICMIIAKTAAIFEKPQNCSFEKMRFFRNPTSACFETLQVRHHWTNLKTNTYQKLIFMTLNSFINFQQNNIFKFHVSFIRQANKNCYKKSLQFFFDIKT